MYTVQLQYTEHTVHTYKCPIINALAKPPVAYSTIDTIIYSCITVN